MKLLGFEFKRVKDQDNLPSFVPKEEDDGSLMIAASGGGYNTGIDFESTVRTESELITRYREMSLHPEVDSAIEEIVNAAVTKNEEQEVVKIFLDKTELSPNIKKKIEDEFTNVLKLLKFNNKFYDIFKRWYVDGRLTYHVIIDPQKTTEGIQELRYIDPRKIRKVREVIKKRSISDLSIPDAIVKTKNEYFVYNDRGYNTGVRAVFPTSTGLRIAKDAILQCTSGIVTAKGDMVLSYLHKAIRQLNMLRTLEDATIIYRISRAPERRVWYIDVGQLPPAKAEQYVRNIMVKHKNKLIYDSASGQVQDSRRLLSMLDDYWLPRREGGKGTEVTTLRTDGAFQSVNDELEIFLRKLYVSLNVPLARMDPQGSMFNLGRPSEITREELKFGKFIDRLRTKFSELFLGALEKQLVIKNIITIEEWDILKYLIEFRFVKDSYFTELKDQEILLSRANVLQTIDPYVGRYFSNKWVRTNILKQSDDDMKKIDKEIEEEQDSYQYMPQDEKMMMKQQQMEQDAQDQQAQQQQDQEVQNAGGPEEYQKQQDAQKVYDTLKDKKPRSLADEAKFKAASQALTKSK